MNGLADVDKFKICTEVWIEGPVRCVCWGEGLGPVERGHGPVHND